MKSNQYFQLGVLMIFFSFILGYGGVAIVTLLYTITQNNFWAFIGPILYTISWIILGFGILLAGKQGVQQAKKMFSGK